MPDYGLYGLVIRSDRALDGLAPAPAGASVDVDVVLSRGRLDTPPWERAAPYYEEPTPEGEPPTLVVRRDAALGFIFRYADGTEFVLDRSATTITAAWAAASTLADTATYLLGPVLGFALRLRGVLAFHASAVLLEGRAVLFAGPSGAGKSTIAAACAAAGVPVLSDDVVAVRMLHGEAMAFPSYRLLRLWDESERILFGTTGELPLLTPTWEKRALPLGRAFPFHELPAPLGDLFLLAPRADDPRAPYVEPMPPGDAFMGLLANTYANYLLDDAMRGEEMRGLDTVVRGRRVRRLVPHADPARLDALVAAVRAAVADAAPR